MCGASSEETGGRHEAYSVKGGGGGMNHILNLKLKRINTAITGLKICPLRYVVTETTRPTTPWQPYITP